MRAILGAIPLAFILTVAACGGSDPVDKDAENADGLETVVAEANAVANAIHNEADASPPAPGTGEREVTPGFAHSRRDHSRAIPGPLGHGRGRLHLDAGRQ
jgi:hypothetical protein